jgi:hypothetical protein
MLVAVLLSGGIAVIAVVLLFIFVIGCLIIHYCPESTDIVYHSPPSPGKQAMLYRFKGSVAYPGPIWGQPDPVPDNRCPVCGSMDDPYCRWLNEKRRNQ